ncbi:hypothetical protein JST97_31565 [bacterium]|nr:hypothetical protein [bacterium]
MISALAGLPSLGGMGGGFDGGSLPLLGFGLLSTFASQLSTQSFLGSSTSIPDLNSTNINFGSFNTNFGSYTGSGATSNGYFYNPNPYGDNPSLHTGASDFRAWHQWATGGVEPPLAVAPFYGQGYGYTNVQFGSAGAYGAVGYGSAGAYGAGSGAFPYSASPAYCPPSYGSQPIFSNAYQAMGAINQTNYVPVPNYTPVQTYIPPTQYNPPPITYTPPAPPAQPTYNYTPPSYPQAPQPTTPGTYTYGTPPTPEQTAAFNSYAQQAVAQFNATGASISGQYSATTGAQAPAFTPASNYDQYGNPTPQATAAFNNYAQQALAQFNATGASISGQYSATTGMQAPAYAPATYGAQPTAANPYGNPTPEQTAAFQNYAQQALAQLNATSASIQSTYQASFSASSSTQVNFGSDITYSLPASTNMPSYTNYMGAYQSLPASYSYGSAAQYGGYSLGWGYPQAQTPVFYGSAMPSYAAPVLQNQTPYGYGGPPHPAPCPPPVYPPRPPYQQQPPVTTPPTQTPPAVVTPPTKPLTEVEKVQAGMQSAGPSTSFTRPARVEYPAVPVIQSDVAGPAAVLGSRLVGDPAKIASYTATNPAPNQNNDANHYERIGLYDVMQQDTSLRYNVDTGRFFRTYDGGVTKDVLDMAQVSQMLRQDHPDNYGRIGALLQHLPTDNQLFGSKEQGTNAPSSFTSSGTIQVPGGFQKPPQPVIPPVQMPTLPPLTTVSLPPFAGFPNSNGQVPELDRLVAQRQAGQITGNDFNLELLRIAANQGALNPNPRPPAAGTAFQITAHRYWDPQRGDYANVSDVLTQGYEGVDQHVFNTQNQSQVTVTRPDVPAGTPVRVTVNWDNGQSRTWDYQVGMDQQSEVDVFSPIG